MKPSQIMKEIALLRATDTEKWFALLEQVSDIWLEEFRKRNPNWKEEEREAENAREFR